MEIDIKNYILKMEMEIEIEMGTPPHTEIQNCEGIYFLKAGRYKNKYFKMPYRPKRHGFTVLVIESCLKRNR